MIVLFFYFSAAFLLFNLCRSATLTDINLSKASSGIKVTNTQPMSETEYDGTVGMVMNALGDINGDSYSDIGLISTSGGYEYIQCSINIIYGSYSPLNIDLHSSDSIITITGSDLLTNCKFATVAYAGDVNGDNFRDILIAYMNSNYVPTYFVIYGGIDISSTINLDELDPSQGFELTYSQETQFSSFSYDHSYVPANGVDDFNGDGFDDLLLFGGRQDETVLYYLFYGGNSTFFDFSLDSNSSIFYFDNFTQNHGILITIPIDDASTSYNSGYGYYSSENVDLGTAISGLGDFNGDGFMDAIISFDYTLYSTGTAYVIYGSDIHPTSINLEKMTPSQGFKILGVARTVSPTYGESLGYSISSAGDVNGDGYDDAVLSAPWASNYAGIVYVVYGGKNYGTLLKLAELKPSQGFLIYPPQGSSIYFGFSVSKGGDINSDGYGDIIVGAPEASGGTGIVYVIYGGVNIISIHVDTLISSQGFPIIGVKNPSEIYQTYYTTSRTGGVVSGGFDFNRDGYDDILISAPGAYNGVTPYFGAVYVIYGSPSIASLSLKYLSSVSTMQTVKGDLIVSMAGDVNNDTYIDFLVGNLDFTSHTVNFTLFFGSDLGAESIQGFTGLGVDYALTLTSSLTVNSYDYSPYYQYNFFSVGSAGDINEDGIDDFIVGLASSPDSYAFVIFGSTSYDQLIPSGIINLDELANNTQLGFVIKGYSNSYTGYSVGSVDNFFGDHKSTLIIGSLYGEDGYSSGMVYLIKSNHTISNIDLTTFKSSQLVKINPQYYYYQLGYSVSKAWDFNGDGYNDIIVSANGGNYYSGMAYIIYGGPDIEENIYLSTMNSTEGIRLIGCGSACLVTEIGDYNGDGYSDVMVADATDSYYTGVTYVIFGNSDSTDISLDIISTPSQGIILKGANSYDYFGSSISRAGDVNGDGLVDILIGSFGVNSYAGTVYIIFGTKSPVDIEIETSFYTTQGIKIYSENLYELVGNSVAGASDVNGNAIVLICNNLVYSYSDKAKSTLYGIIPRSSPKAKTSAPSHKPTMMPSHSPTLAPAPPTYLPTKAPTPAPFWQTNGPLILGVAVPAALGFVPIFFSKQICFWVLDHWSSAHTGRGLLKIATYNACKKIFLKDYIDSKEIKQKRKEIQKTEESLDIEMNALLSKPNQPDTTSFNPLLHRKALEQKGLIEEGEFQPQKIESAPLVIQDEENPLADRKSYAFRSSMAPDSDDEDVAEHEARAEKRPSKTSRDSKGSNHGDESNNNIVVRAVYQLHFDDPEIDALFNKGVFLLKQPSHKTEETILPVPDNSKSNQLVNLPSSKQDGESRPSSSSYSAFILQEDFGILANDFKYFVEHIYLLEYSVDHLLLPFFDSFTEENDISIAISKICQQNNYQNICIASQSIWQKVWKNRVLLVTSHFIAGNMVVWALSPKELSRGLILSSSSSLSFGGRIWFIDMMQSQKKEWFGLNSPSSTDESNAINTIGYCLTTATMTFLPDAMLCMSFSFLFPGSDLCGMTDWQAKLSIVGAECFLAYKAVEEKITLNPNRKSEEVILVEETIPYVVDTWVILSSMWQGYSWMASLKLLVTADYTSRILLNLLPSELKSYSIGFQMINQGYSTLRSTSNYLYQQYCRFSSPAMQTKFEF